MRGKGRVCADAARKMGWKELCCFCVCGSRNSMHRSAQPTLARHSHSRVISSAPSCLLPKKQQHYSPELVLARRSQSRLLALSSAWCLSANVRVLQDMPAKAATGCQPSCPFVKNSCRRVRRGCLSRSVTMGSAGSCDVCQVEPLGLLWYLKKNMVGSGILKMYLRGGLSTAVVERVPCVHMIKNGSSRNWYCRTSQQTCHGVLMKRNTSERATCFIGGPAMQQHPTAFIAGERVIEKTKSPT